MTESRKIQLETGVDATGARKGFEEVKAAGHDMAQSVAQAGKDASKGVDAIADSAKRAGQGGKESLKPLVDGFKGLGDESGKTTEKLDRTTKSIISSIQRTTAVMEAGERGSVKYYEALAQQRGANVEVLRPYLDSLDAAKRRQDAANDSLGKMGMSARQTAAALRGVPAQFTDIATSIAAGQNPLTVMLQQGGQLKDMFGGIGPAARALGGYVAGLVNPLTLAAAGVATLGVAFFQGTKESEGLAKAITLTGNAAGVTLGRLNTVAQAVAGATGATQGAAAETLEKLVASGRVAAGNLQAVAQAAVLMERATGQAVADTVKQFEDLGRSPVEAAAKLNEQQHFLTAEIYAQVKALDDQGRSAEAAALAQTAYANALSERSQAIVQNLGTLESAWIGVKDTAKEAWDAMLDVGRTETPEDRAKALANKIADLQERLARQQGAGGGLLNNFLAGRTGRQLDEARGEQAAAQETARMLQQAAGAAAERARQEQAGIEWLKEGDKFLTKRAQMEREIAKARALGGEAGLSQLKIDERIAQIQEKYATKAPKVADTSRNDFAQVIRGRMESISGRESADVAAASGFDPKDVTSQIASIERIRDIHVEASASRAAALGLLAMAQKDAGDRAKTLADIDKESAVAAAANAEATNDIVKINEALAASFGELSKREQEALIAQGLSGEAQAVYVQARQEATAADKEALATKLELRALIADEAGENALADRYFAAAEAARAYATSLREVGQAKVRDAQDAGLDTALNDVAAAAGNLDNSLASAASGFTKLLKAQRDYGKEKGAIEKAFAVGTKERYEAEMALAKRSTHAQMAGIAEIAGGLKGMFKAHSAGYKAMESVEKGFRLFEMGMAIKNAAEQMGLITSVAAAKSAANQQSIAEAGTTATAEAAAAMTGGSAKAVEAVANQGAKGDPYSAFPRMAAMAAAMAALGFVVSGGFGGGSGESPGEAARKAAQAGQGTGTVLGDPTAKSESVDNALELLGDVNTQTMRYSAQMADSLRNIEANFRGFATLLVRGVGLDPSKVGWSSSHGDDMWNKSGEWLNDIGRVLSHDPIGRMDSNAVARVRGFLDKNPLIHNDSRVVGKISSGLFGKTSQSMVDSGVNLGAGTVADYIDREIALLQYSVIETTKKSWFKKSSSRSAQFAGLDAEVYNQVSAMFTGLADSMAAAAGALKLDPSAMFAEVLASSINIGQISLQGMNSGAIQEAISSVFSAAFDRLGAQVMPELRDFQQVGEGYYQTIIRVASGYEQAGSVLDNLGIQLIAFSDVSDMLAEDIGAEFVRDSLLAHEAMLGIGEGIADIVAAASGGADEIAGLYRELDALRATIASWGLDGAGLGIAMIRGAGGLDNLSSGMSAFEESFFSEAEQLAAQRRQVAHEFARLGLSMPDTKEAFRNMVEALDMTTDAGQTAFGQLMQVAPAYADLADAAAAAAEEQLSAQQEIRDAWQATADSILETMRRLRGDLLGTGSRGFAAAQADFALATAAARAGDQDAAGRLPQLAQAVVDLGKAVSASSAEQALLTARTLASLSATVQGMSAFGIELPQFAVGADILPRDMVAVVHEGERIVPAAENRELIRRLSQGAPTIDLGPLLSEVSALRAEVRAVAGHTSKTARVMERMDDDDALTVRVVA